MPYSFFLELYILSQSPSTTKHYKTRLQISKLFITQKPISHTTNLKSPSTIGKNMASSSQVHKKYELDCQYIHSHFFGNGVSNQQKLVETLTSRNLDELKLIKQIYSAVYNQDLLHLLYNIPKKDAFARAVYLRLNEPSERDADILRNAIFGGIIVDLSTVIEILCSRSSSELQSIKRAYCSRYSSQIEHNVSLKINGGFKEILLAVLKASHYGKAKVDTSMAMCDAKTLYEAMETGKYIDQKNIISVLSQRSTGQLKAILVSYKHLYGHEFSKSLKRTKCEQFGKELRTVIRCIQYPEKYFAKKLRKTPNNTDSKEVLIRTIITRSGIDIKDVNNAYAAKAGYTLDNLTRRKLSSNPRNQTSVDKVNDLVAEFLVELLKR